MPLYNYSAIDPDGRRVSGQIDAVNLVDLELRLKRIELDLITGNPVSNRTLFGRHKVSRREQLLFCLHLEQMTRSGIPLLEGLADLRDSLEHPRLREIVASLIESIEGGATLSQAMEKQTEVFDSVFINLIKAGETSGQLPQILLRVTESLKWQDELASHTQKLMLYPAFIAIVVLVAMCFLMIYMVPQMKMFVTNMGHSLPWQTRLLFAISDGFVRYWPLVLAAPLLGCMSLRIGLQKSHRFKRRFDELKLRLPFAGTIIRKVILARFASTFSLLYISGVPILQAIQITQKISGNLEIEAGLERVNQLISDGQSVTTAFHTSGLFPPLVIRMLKLGENAGTIDKALDNIAYFYHRDVKESVEKAQQLIEPLLTVILGGLLGWIMLSILGPIYDVISRIGA